MRSPRSLTVISLGGGVQSSVMALMAGDGAFDRVPDCAVFADTKWEPPSIYTHLEWLEGQLRFPLYVVDNGRNLREDVKALTNHSGNRPLHGHSRIPERTGRTGGRHRAGGNAPRATRSGPSVARCASCLGLKKAAESPRRTPPSSCGLEYPQTRPSA